MKSHKAEITHTRAGEGLTLQNLDQDTWQSLCTGCWPGGGSIKHSVTLYLTPISIKHYKHTYKCLLRIHNALQQLTADAEVCITIY